MALILAYQIFYYAPRMKKVEEMRKARLAQEELERMTSIAAGDSTRLASGIDSLDTPVPGDVRAFEPTPDQGLTQAGLPHTQIGSGQRIVVTTPLYEMTLSTTGAEIVSVRLLEFETFGEPVQLFNGVGGDEADTPTGGAADVTLRGDEEVVPLSNVFFEASLEGRTEPLADGATVRLDERTPNQKIVFRAEGPNGKRIEKDFTFAYDNYVVQSGIHFSSTHFPFVRRVEWGLGPGLKAVEANPQDDHGALRAHVRLGDEYHTKKRGDCDENFSGMVHWAAVQIKYFTAIVMAEEAAGGGAHIEGRKADNYLTASIELPAPQRRGSIDQTVDLYLGPIDYGILKSFGRGLERNVDMGVRIFRPVSQGILWSLVKLYKIIPNYGLVIIILSVFTKILFYRLTHKSFKSMRDMQALQPRLQALKEKYKDDRQRISQETMKLYKEAGVNPLGGCLPMLFQMPVFIALFNVLRSTIELRRAPFVGWIDDLSLQDVLFRLPFTLPFIGDAVSVLPILMGAGMLFQSKIGGSIAGPSSSATQPKAFTYMLPIVFTVLFYRMPSGLVLYWIVNTVLSVGQQYYINKGADKEEKANANNSRTPDKPTEEDKPNGAVESEPAKLDKPGKSGRNARPRRSKTSGKRSKTKRTGMKSKER
jgi:YidC/Oxa1 family membrane protein insertase